MLGLIIGVVVLAASAHDNAAGTALLDQAAGRCGNRLEKALVDQGLGRLTRQGFLTQPGRGAYQKRT